MLFHLHCPYLKFIQPIVRSARVGNHFAFDKLILGGGRFKIAPFEKK
jgi:hypothetical protein